MTASFTAACIQLNSKRDIAANLPDIKSLILEAASTGADLITLPECTAMLEPEQERLFANAPGEDNHPTLDLVQGLARETGAWVLLGSAAILLGNGKIANRSYLFGGNGDVAATYDKIHMFDVELGDGQTYKESATYAPGSKAVTTQLPWGILGLTICYDLRFPYLYRALAHAGADFLAIPAAFTKVSGEAHWHVLQRARAIETGCYVVAPAQCGTHAEGRQTFGHSLIVDPWGTVLADGGEDVGIITAEIDAGLVTEARAKIPALTHDRDISL
ncbi:MAG: carbon-nitrogen hydrolase family protein [Rhodospirillales bacterium]|nr:carbon-nitrogen hydrolase family protein [Rhodospirillales bacterium]